MTAFNLNKRKIGKTPQGQLKFKGRGDAWLFNNSNYGTLNHEMVGVLTGVTPVADWLHCDGSSSASVILADSAGKFCPEAPFTIAYKFNIHSYTANDRLIDCKPIWNSTDGWSLSIGSSTRLDVLTNGSTVTSLSNAWDLNAGKTEVTFIIRYNGSSKIEVWTNYGGYASRDTGGTPTINSSTNSLNLFRYIYSSNSSPEGDIKALFLYNGMLSDAKVDSLLRDVYQDLEPVRTVQDSAYAALFGSADAGNTINADYLASASSIYEPTITTIATISADYLTSASQIYQPSVTAEQTLNADYLASASQVYQPTITAGVTINADYLASASQVFEPTITTVVTISADYLGSASQVFEPTLSSGLLLSADYLASSNQVYEPTLTTEATIDADYLGGNSQVFEPTLELMLQTIEVDYLASNSQVFEPTITGGAITEEETTTGGWDYPQRPDAKEERIRLGIVEPDKPKKKIKLVSKVSEIKTDFSAIKSLAQADKQKQQLQQLQQRHEAVKRRGIEKKLKEAADKAILQRISLALNELEHQKQLIEERDIVFVMMILAA